MCVGWILQSIEGVERPVSIVIMWNITRSYTNQMFIGQWFGARSDDGSDTTLCTSTTLMDVS